MVVGYVCNLSKIITNKPIKLVNHFVKCRKFSTSIRILSISKEKSSVSNYCLNNVRQFDYENFLAVLLLNTKIRRNAIAIRAFNVEIARIHGLVSEDKIGEMRLKFWEEGIDKVFDTKGNPTIPDHPVLNELKNITSHTKLTKQYFQRLIKCRNRPGNLSFLTLKQLEDYAEQSVSSVYYLLLESAGIKNVNADHAVSHLGKAQGITNLMRSIPHQRRNQIMPIPQEILIKHGISYERILRDESTDKGVENCVFEIAGVAHQHLEKAKSLVTQIPKESKAILLPSVAVSRYLERLRLVNFHLTSKELHQRDSLLPSIYFWYNLRGKY